MQDMSTKKPLSSAVVAARNSSMKKTGFTMPEKSMKIKSKADIDKMQ